jgi:hypothetical protein
MTQEFKAGKYTATVSKRENLTNYPNAPYMVRVTQETPKAKYFKTKTLYNYVFKSLEEAEKYANSYINRISANLESRQNELNKKRELNKNISASDFYKVGDVICNSWGYEQTNVEFYQVIKVGQKSIEIKEIYQKTVQGSEAFMSCSVLPDIDNFKENGDSYTLRVKHEGRLSNPKSFYYMFKHKGNPQYNSWYA